MSTPPPASTPVDGDSHSQAPPRRGLPLGLRLGLLTSLIVVVVMGVLTVAGLMRDTSQERAAREALLQESMAPLVADLEEAATADDLRERVRAYHEAFVRLGQAPHHVELRDDSGRVVATTLPEHGDPPSPALTAALPVSALGFPRGAGTLIVWRDGGRFADEVALRWRYGWLDIAVTVLCILLSLLVAHRKLIARPLAELLASVARLERGHWRALSIPRGAWEIRWLAWRFRQMGAELEGTVRRLVQAQQRALLLVAASGDEPPPVVDPAVAAGPLVPERATSLHHDLARHYLRDRGRLLRSQDPRSSESRRLALAVWEHDALEAERLGAHELKAELENTAFRVLWPDAHARLEGEVLHSPVCAPQWSESRIAELRAALDAAGVGVLALQARRKHLAGIWRKMHSKNLSFGDVEDLLALRVIVANESDCYRALESVHRRFEALPLRFKDYIADPKPNGYQSLHTCLRAPDGYVFEVQIRSAPMHRQAEGGQAAHWRYKDSTSSSPDPTSRGLRARVSGWWARLRRAA